MLNIFLHKYIIYSRSKMVVLNRWIIASETSQFDLVATCPSVQRIQTSGTFRNWDAKCWIYTLVLNWVNSEDLKFTYLEHLLFQFCVSRPCCLYQPGVATNGTCEAKAFANRHLTDKVYNTFLYSIPQICHQILSLSDVFCCFPMELGHFCYKQTGRLV